MEKSKAALLRIRYRGQEGFICLFVDHGMVVCVVHGVIQPAQNHGFDIRHSIDDAHGLHIEFGCFFNFVLSVLDKLILLEEIRGKHGGVKTGVLSIKSVGLESASFDPAIFTYRHSPYGYLFIIRPILRKLVEPNLGEPPHCTGSGPCAIDSSGWISHMHRGWYL